MDDIDRLIKENREQIERLTKELARLNVAVSRLSETQQVLLGDVQETMEALDKLEPALAAFGKLADSSRRRRRQWVELVMNQD